MSLSLCYFGKRPNQDVAISHSMALPVPINSHVDCIGTDRADAQLEPRGCLSYVWAEGGSGKLPGVILGTFRAPCREQCFGFLQSFPSHHTR